MRRAFIIFTFFCDLTLNCQITLLNTGTTVTLKHLSCIGNTVLVGGLSGNYLRKSYNEGYSLTTLPSPGLSINNSFYQRLDKDTVFLLSIGNSAELYRSVDGASGWSKRMDTTIFVPNAFVFFNGREGIEDYGYGNQVLRTKNGGGAWTLTTCPLGNITMYKTFGDSTVIMGGSTPPNTGGDFLVSKDRGHTWPYSFGMFNTPTDFCFLNADTIFGISNRNTWGSSFVRSMNGGQNWQILPEPLYYNDGMAKKANEIFIVGADNQNIGIIAKSADYGLNWYKFNTGVNSRLMNLIFLNDSIALLSGTNGVLLRWNFKKTIFTGINENTIENESPKIYPNPFVQGEFLCLVPVEKSDVVIKDISGRIIFNGSVTGRIPIPADLQPGVYIVSVQNGETVTVTKIIRH